MNEKLKMKQKTEQIYLNSHSLIEYEQNTKW